MICNNISNVSFNGITKIYAISDTHQETRRTAAFLSKIIKESKNKSNSLFLHCGDFLEGIYPKEMERDCYIKMKQSNPNIEMVMTLGNHDFGHNKKGFEFLLDTVKKFIESGIKVVSANLTDFSGKKIEGVKPYTIVTIDGDKNFITGFCTKTFFTQGHPFVKPNNQKKAIDELKIAIDKEKPDNVIIMNHDFLDSSNELLDYCREKGIKVDLTIGGHDHRPVQPNTEKSIYYPETFGEEMYSFDLVNQKGEKKLSNIKQIKNSDTAELDAVFNDFITQYEQKNGILEPIAKSTLNLTKDYNNPCSYGSFLADSMKDAAHSDIAFFSTGFLKHPIPYKKGEFLTFYDYKRSMPTETPIQTVELNSSELKEIFSHALKSRGYCEGNPRFLQCSNNIKITGKSNDEKQCFEIKQIYINNEALLDTLGNPISKDKTFKCAIDSYIADGKQEFKILGDKEKKIVFINNEESNIGKILENALSEAPSKYSEGLDYPCYKIITL